MALLEISNLVVEFSTSSGPFRAVDGISLNVDTRQVLAIVGESGSGKSVAMMAVMGLLPFNAKVTADKMLFEGRNILALTPAQRQARQRKRKAQRMAELEQENQRLREALDGGCPKTTSSADHKTFVAKLILKALSYQDGVYVRPAVGWEDYDPAIDLNDIVIDGCGDLLAIADAIIAAGYVRSTK